jgi:hypothetical protein
MEFFIGALFVWIMCAIICAVIAGNKGRSSIGWGILGFLLGPLGIVLALVVSSKKAPIESVSIEHGDIRACPFCAEPIKRQAIKCKHCGSDVPVEEAVEAPISAFFERPDGMSIGEYHEEVFSRYEVSRNGSAYLWRGQAYSSFADLISEIKRGVA